MTSSPTHPFPSFVTGALRVAPGSLPPGLAEVPPAAEPLPAEFDSNTLLHMPRPVIAIAKNYPQGADTREHSHPRPQLLHAVDGLMRVSTDAALWLIPPQRALWIPAGVRHAVTMLTPVTMRSAYVDAEAAPALGSECQLLEVSRLLRELMLALTALPIAYPVPGRGAHLAALVLSEIEAAATVPIDIPWPRDRRLVAMCSAILADPGRRATLEVWADEVGASARTVVRLFARETGLRFRQWLRQVHLAVALCRLAQGESVAVLARELGYASPSAFTAMFRRALGRPPNRYFASQRQAETESAQP